MIPAFLFALYEKDGMYYPLVHALAGQVIHISPTSKDYINPMDIIMDYSDDDNPLGVKSDFVLSLCELIMGSRDGIEAEEKSVIDRCLPLVYQKYFADPRPENKPVLGDLYDCLRKQKEPQVQRIATALEIYVNGSLKVFNHQTNVEMDNRIICFDIKDLGKQLNISPYQLSYVTNSGEGEGFLFYGSTIIPFKDKFDKTLKLYSLMTTKPEEVEARKQKEMEE